MTPEIEEALKDPYVEQSFWHAVRFYRKFDFKQHRSAVWLLSYLRSEGIDPISLLAINLGRTEQLVEESKKLGAADIKKMTPDQIIEHIADLDKQLLEHHVESLWLQAFEYPTIARQRFVARIRALMREAG